ncbi:DUF2927 domain-containing protein [Ahrensia marina]|uniref:DUF2927 domain-containing protein n=1 Tax=Ahrensia marina TaxID=1514904 RepID=UPI0035CEC5AF
MLFRSSNQLLSVRAAAFAMLMSVTLLMGTQASFAQSRFSDAALADGFFRTVFGLEYAASSRGASVVKKFVEPVRLYIDHRARADRRRDVERFVSAVNQAVRGLDLQVVNDPRRANFTVYVVDRAQYADVIRNDIYNSPRAQVRGRCMVRVLTGTGGISRAQAVIVSDEGDFLFNRCLVEEVLQGLGPLNDDPTLTASVFNDQSRHTRFMLHDRYVLNMLYHPRIQPGMSRDDVNQVLRSVLADVHSWLR